MSEPNSADEQTPVESWREISFGTTEAEVLELVTEMVADAFYAGGVDSNTFGSWDQDDPDLEELDLWRDLRDWTNRMDDPTERLERLDWLVKANWDQLHRSDPDHPDLRETIDLYILEIMDCAPAKAGGSLDDYVDREMEIGDVNPAALVDHLLLCKRLAQAVQFDESLSRYLREYPVVVSTLVDERLTAIVSGRMFPKEKFDPDRINLVEIFGEDDDANTMFLILGRLLFFAGMLYFFVFT